jgi:hypothetical protein
MIHDTLIAAEGIRSVLAKGTPLNRIGTARISPMLRSF